MSPTSAAAAIKLQPLQQVAQRVPIARQVTVVPAALRQLQLHQAHQKTVGVAVDPELVALDILTNIAIILIN